MEKALNGLKHFAVQWFKELGSTTLTVGGRSSYYDECLYYHSVTDGRVMPWALT